LKAAHVKPTNVDYVEEIHRRFDVMKSLLEDPSLLGVAPQPKGWNTEKLVGWLDTHPVDGVDDGVEDVDYLTRIVANRKALATQIAQQQDSADGGKKNWTGKYPYLCLIHCLVDNENIKHLYLQRNKIETGRLHLDNRISTEKQDPTVWEKMSNTFNDPTFAPETEAVVDLHTDYIKSEIALHLYVMECNN
jgi:hypothetical protein